METIKLQVSGSQIEVVERPAVITAGTVGLNVEFIFDSQWDSLSKTAVFRAEDKVITTTLEGNVHTVPWEVMEKPDLWLCIGVYGANAEGTVVIPTLWAKVAAVYTGVDPEGDPALEPAKPIWQETLARVDNIEPAVYDHINNVGGYNPHGVTCEQIAAVHVDALDGRVENLLERNGVNYHIRSKENPHEVTAEQIGATPNATFEIFVENIEDRVGDLMSRIADVEPLAESADAHTVAKNNPHSVTCEQIGAATKADIENTKAVVVTVSGSTASLTSQQILEAVQSGHAVYLKMWSGTYMGLSWCTASEAVFEASLSQSITGADGNSYPVQDFRLFIIRGNMLAQIYKTMASKDYVDAQIAYYLNQ